MQAIVAVDDNWAIGCDGQLLFSIPEDMRFFKETTTGRVVVMGRRTFQSLPSGRPLRDRVNIVLSGDPDFTEEGITVCRSPEKLLETLAGYPADDVFVIGGAEIYALLLPYCAAVLVTKVRGCYLADRYFPNLDKLPDWRLADCGDEREYRGMRYCFCKYVRTD
ncbi:MAG: dihydrofolate reductase [Oscillospiraceae bacterium]|nr:dihydrofolate reductase [Oscillospiraceae bacterium]